MENRFLAKEIITEKIPVQPKKKNHDIRKGNLDT